MDLPKNKGEYEDYQECRADAQKTANMMGQDVGLEYNDLFKYYRYFSLPNPENRTGFELRCEVVRPDAKDWSHGTWTAPGNLQNVKKG